MKTTFLIRRALAGILIGFLLMSTYDAAKVAIFKKEKITRCGTITFKGNRDQVNKYSTNTEFILVVKYDDTGRKEDEHVSASTWSTYKVGDRICFTETAKPNDTLPQFLYFFLGVIGLIVVAVCIIIFCFYLLRWIFTGAPISDFFKKEND